MTILRSVGFNIFTVEFAMKTPGSTSQITTSSFFPLNFPVLNGLLIVHLKNPADLPDGLIYWDKLITNGFTYFFVGIVGDISA